MFLFLQGYYTHCDRKTYFITLPLNETTRTVHGPVTFTHEFLGEYTSAEVTDSTNAEALAPGMVVATTTGERVRVHAILAAPPASTSEGAAGALFRPPSNVGPTIAIMPSPSISAN
jgi:hypothetical protein